MFALRGGDAQGDQLVSIENVVGTRFVDKLLGNAADNTFEGGGGGDFINGGDGSDTASYASSAQAVQINLYQTTQHGGDAEGDQLSSIENAIGSSHDDDLIGNDGLNHLSGGDGEDFLFGGFDGQVDVLDGGTGEDLVDYSFASRGMTIVLNQGDVDGSATLVSESHQVGTTLTGMPLYSFTPAVQEDTLRNIEDVTGTLYNDGITGNSADNTIHGLDGNDYLAGGAGSDYVDGGVGIDTAVLDSSSGTGVTVSLVDQYPTLVHYANGDVDTLVSIENIVGTDYDDTIFGNALDNNLNGGAGNDTLAGGDGADTLYGGYGNDILVGGSGNDLLFGSFGDDTLLGGAGADRLDGGAGVNTASYAGTVVGVNVDLTAGTGSGGDAQGDTFVNIQNVTGSAAGDKLVGDGNANVLDGGHGNDTLVGNGGNDMLIAGTGNDILVGGTGDDTFKFDFTGDPEFNQTYLGNDTIMDWQSGHDHVEFDNLAPDMTIHVAQVGADTVITFDHVSGSITVLNAHATDFM